MKYIFLFEDKELEKLYKQGIHPSKKQIREKGLYIMILFIFLFLDSLLKLMNFCFFFDNNTGFMPIPMIIRTTLYFILFLLYYFIQTYEITKLKNLVLADSFYMIFSTISFIFFCEAEIKVWKEGNLITELLFEGIKLFLIEFIYIYCFFSWKSKLFSILSLSLYILIRFQMVDIIYLFCNFLIILSMISFLILEERFKRITFIRMNEGLKDITKLKSFNSKITLINEKERSAISDKILDNIEEGILVVDKDANIIKMNEPIIKLFKEFQIDINDIVLRLMSSKIVTVLEAPDFILNFVSPSDIHISTEVKSKICNSREKNSPKEKEKSFLKAKARTSHLFQFDFNGGNEGGRGKRQSRLNTVFGSRNEGGRRDTKNLTTHYNNYTSTSQSSTKNQGLNMPVKKAIELIVERAEFFEEKEQELELMTNQKNEDNYRINCDIELFEKSAANLKDISKFHLRILTTSFRDELRFIFIMKQRKMEIENRHLEVQNENKSKTLAFVSHEMRTPLNCILGMLAVLETMLDPITLDSYVIPAIACGKHLMNLLNDLLDAAQIQAGKFKLVFIEFDLKSLLSDVLFMINIQARPKGLELILEWDNNLSHIVKSDPNRIRQIVINLLGNALKFTQKGSIRVITEKNPKNNTLIHIKVVDTGMGIKEESKKKLFQAFGKLDQDESEYLNSQGVGLGLLISNILAKNLGPSLKTLTESDINLMIGLNVISEYGKGTQFEFIIENKNDTDLLDEASVHVSLGEMKSHLVTEIPYFFKKPKLPEFIDRKLDMYSIRSESEREVRIVSSARVETEPMASSSKSSYEHKSDFTIKKDSNQINKRSLSKSKEELGSTKSFFYMSKDYDKRALNNHSLLYDMVVSRVGKEKFITRNLEDVTNNEEKVKILNDLNKEKKCLCPDLLICDDSQFNIVVLKAMLEVYKFKIESAYHGEEAIEKIQKLYESSDCCRTYKIIFMDIEMPIMDGYETCDMIFDYSRRMGFEPPLIIATTGHSSKKEQKKILERGMNDCLIKPILKGALVDMVVQKLFNLEKYPISLYPERLVDMIGDRIREGKN